MSSFTLKDYLVESRLFINRSLVAGAAVILLVLMLLFRLFYLQVVNHDHYKTLSMENRVKLVPLPPTRGLIYDRNGVLLAQNLPAYSLEIVAEKVDDMQATLAELGRIVDISEDDLSRFEHLRNQRRRFDSVPLKVRLQPEEVARLAVNLHRFPGVSIQAQLLRHYPMMEHTAHLLGYVGRINEQELQRIDQSDYAGTHHIGKNGVEKSYEALLHGDPGMQQVEVNALGRTIRVLQQEPPVPGRTLKLYLDVRLQEVAIKAFGDEIGAAVAIDPNTGGVLALVSKPGFDPNLFVEGISSKQYKALRDHLDKPLFNRALRGQYPPGSTVKPFIGLGGLETGSIGFEEQTYCPGFYQLPNSSHRYRDWKKGGHGPMAMKDAIVQSCDVYFYDLAHTMGVTQLHDFLAQFGFGSRTGVDLVGELGGLLPSREWKRRVRNQTWYPGETLIMGIGQGYFLATPLQLAAATAAMANGGYFHTPRIVQSVDEGGEPGEAFPGQLKDAEIPKRDEQHWLQVLSAMTDVVEGPRGTARRIRNEHYRVAGKTGTAQVFTVKQDEEYDEDKVDKKMRDHALFIAFAPVENPQIAVAIVVENGGHGGSTAAPIAKAIMDAYLLEEEQ